VVLYREYVHAILTLKGTLQRHNASKTTAENHYLQILRVKDKKEPIDTWERARIDACAARMIHKESV
jgi:hypothetical protein